MRPSRWQPALLSLLCLVQSTAGAPAPIPPHRAEYLLSRDALPFATLVMELEHTSQGGYRYTAVTRPHGALALVRMAMDIAAGARVQEVSEGEIVDGGFRPRRYLHRRSNQEERSLVVAFDWDKGRAEVESEDRPWSMEIPAGTQDKLSVLLALRADLARGGRGGLSFQVADGGRLKEYGYREVGRDQAAGPAGSWPCLVLERSKNDAPPDYRLWLAPELHFLPVRVERNENGALFRMELESLESGGDPASAGP